MPNSPDAGRYARMLPRITGADAGRTILSVLALACIIRSFAYSVRHYTPQAFFDLWLWVADFQLWADGKYTLHDLLKPHYGQHRIATTRVLLLLDSIWFDMTGASVMVINMAVLCGVGALLWRLARLDGVARTGWTLPPLFWLALMLSVCQVDNIIFPFQVQFALICACAVGSASLLADATSPAFSTRWPAAWRAFGAGVLAVAAAFSMASGVLLAPGLFVLLVLRRARPLVWAVFGPVCVLGEIAFFRHYPHMPGPPLFDRHLAADRIVYIGNFLGSGLTAFPHIAAGAGLVAAALFVVACGSLARRFLLRGDTIEAGDAALVALGIFVGLCGPAASMTLRLLMGPDASLVSRYGTMSLLFAAVLAALYARWGARAGQAAWARQMGLPCAGAILLCVMNVPAYDRMATGLQRGIVEGTELLRNNIGIEGPVAVIFGGGVDDIRAQLRFLQSRKTNMFSAEFQPPEWLLARLRGADLASLPACRGQVDDAYAIDGSAFLVRGWMADPQATHTLPWIAALDAHGAVLGTFRALAGRADVQQSLGVAPPALGFEAGFRLAGTSRFGASPVDIRLAGLDPGGAAPLCALRQPARIDPVLFSPVRELRDLARTGDRAPLVSPSAGGFVPWFIARRAIFQMEGAEQPDPAPVDGQAWRVPRGHAPATLMFRIGPAVPDRALAIPFAYHGGSAADRMTVAFGDGTVFDTPVPWLWGRMIWRAAILPPAILMAHGGAVSVTVKAGGDRALWAAAPLWVTLRPDWSRLF